jgi:hypothetical protein
MFRAIRPAALYRSAALYKATPAIVARNAMALNFARTYASAGLARSDVEKRVLDILAGFNKIDANKVNYTTTSNDKKRKQTGVLKELLAAIFLAQGKSNHKKNNKKQKSRGSIEDRSMPTGIL